MRLRIAILSLPLMVNACSDSKAVNEVPAAPTGGAGGSTSPATGGSAAAAASMGLPTGGFSSTGGAVSTSGGVAVGGVGASGSGGVSVSGGTTGSGGVSVSGGAAGSGGVSGGAAGSGGVSGGAAGSGGVGPAGGTSGSGGSPSGGVDPGTGGGEVSGTGGGSTGSTYNPDFVEFYGEDCEVGEPQEENSSTLPDLFEFFDGSRMSKKSEWRCRRAELKKAVEKYIEGEKPGRPTTVTGSVSSSSVEVRVEHDGKSAEFSSSVSMPSGSSGPVPAVVVLGGGFGGSSLEPTLKAEGVATINFDSGAIASETSRSGLFSNIYGNTGTSALVAWGWGVSRIIDVLIDERDAGRNDIIDPTAIGITGCSRLGKGAFIIGAFDERIALGLPQESGTGGVSAFRIVNTNPTGPNGKPAQSLSSAWTEAQGWFGSAFGNYRNSVDSLPVDTHSIVAMYAPRGLLVLDNSRIGELCSTCQHAASVAGAEVYKALGVEKNIAYHGGNANDPHDHCSFYSSQEEPLKRAIRAHLTRKAEPDGRMEPQPAGTADLDKWIGWDAPTLTED